MAFVRSITFSVDADTLAWLQRAAEENGETLSEIIRGCIQDARAMDDGKYVPAPGQVVAEPVKVCDEGEKR